MARLVLINGLPGIGKTTLAERYLVDHSLALSLDIDALRTRMGQWEAQEQSKPLARSLAVAMAGAHLRSGHDVVVPQLVARIGFIEVLERVAENAHAVFHEFVLSAPPEDALGRFNGRREGLLTKGVVHPGLAVSHDTTTMRRIAAELERIVMTRPGTRVLDTTTGDVESTYRALRALLQS